MMQNHPQMRVPPSPQSMKASAASNTPPTSPGAIETPDGGGGFDATAMPLPGEGAMPQGMAPPGQEGPDIGQLIGQLAMVIQAQTGQPPTPQQLQAALAALMGGGGAPGQPPGMTTGAPPAMMG